MGCRTVSSRLITIHLRAVSFNITIVQVHTAASDNYDDEIEENYDQLENVIDQTPKKDILVKQADCNVKVGKNACENWQGNLWTLLQRRHKKREDSDFWSLPPLTILLW